MNKMRIILEKVVGPENVSDDEYELIGYSKDASADIRRVPSVIVRPRTTEQVSMLVRLANRTKMPVMPRGGGSNVVGCLIEGAMVLDLTGMNKIIKIDEESCTVTAQAGITWQELIMSLNRVGWTTGPRPHSAPTATLGGSVALCANGVTSAKYGLIGEQVVGLEVVLPTGEILRTGAGANPSASNFIRYAFASDLTGLFIGSHGLFGVITEVTMKIYPLPETKKCLGYTFDTIEDATRAMRDIQLKHLPLERMYLETPSSLKYFYPNLKANAALVPIVVEGTEDETRISKHIVEEVCLGRGGKVIETNILEEVSRNLDLIYFNVADYRAFGIGVNEVPLCSCVPTPYIPKIVKMFEQICEREDIEGYGIIGAIDAFACKEHAVVSPLLHYEMKNNESANKCREVVKKLVIALMDVGFTPHYLGRLKGPPELLWKLGAYYETLRTLKKTLDPNNVMNPGLLGMPEF
jgi:FAD/FMN-containing dehydrogenase